MTENEKRKEGDDLMTFNMIKRLVQAIMIFKNISFMKKNRVGFEPSPVLNLSLIDIDTNICLGTTD